jgi:hypothetical protein
MKYFVTKLEALRNMDLTWVKFEFWGIINNVQHRIAKNGKGWGMFTLGMMKVMSFEFWRRVFEVSSFYSK